MSSTKRRSVRQQTTRKRSIYVDPDTEDDFEIESEDEDFRTEEPVAAAAPPRKKRKTARHIPQTRSKAKTKTTRTVKSVFKIAKPRRPNSSKMAPQEKKEFDGPSDHRIPDWTSLPVDILRDVFIYAAHPMHHQQPQASANVSWLMKAARTCRAFALPALEAYYQSPAMLTSLHPHHFLDLLQMPKDKRYLDYNVKPKSLFIDVRKLAYVAHNKPAFDLLALVPELPLLQHVEIIYPDHQPPYRPVTIQRWTFPPPELFATMDERNIRLKTWRWSRDMIPKNGTLDLYSMMTIAHQSKVFSRLERLVVCGFNYENSSEPVVGAGAAEDSVGPGLATSVKQLPALKDLSFVTCDVVMDKFLQRLPTTLERLELSNCLEITSDMMRTFFSTSGAQLREVVLNHNAALSLSFLQGLKASCPRLEILKVDLHYFSERVTVNDAEAFYDELMSVDEIPTWPASLQELEIVHAQKWSPEAAQNLFRSLIESASELLDLRLLVLHAHINIPWRDRVGFRDQWIERLRRVYLRQSEEPSKHLGSLKQYRQWRQAQPQTRVVGGTDHDELGLDHSDDDLPLTTRRMSHVQVSPHKPSGDTDVYSDSDEPTKPTTRHPRRSRRVAESQISRASKSATPVAKSETSEDESGQEEDWRTQPEKFVQGMCEVVDIRIDNQRPREQQWREGDFLDSEVSGDEDWHEGADEEQEESYAW